MNQSNIPQMSEQDISYTDYYSHGSTLVHSERFEWVINTFIKPVNGNKILEIGCGDAGCIYYLNKLGFSVYGADYSESAIEKAKSNGLQVFQFDASNDVLPFPENYFDIVICLETYEHLRNPQHCTEEILKVLKTGGNLIISVPNPRFAFESHGYLYPCLFRVKNFVEYFENNGFQLKKVRPHANFSIFNKIINSPKSPLSYVLPKKLKQIYKDLLEEFLPFHCADYSNLYCLQLVKEIYKDLYAEIAMKTKDAYKA